MGSNLYKMCVTLHQLTCMLTHALIVLTLAEQLIGVGGGGVEVPVICSACKMENE